MIDHAWVLENLDTFLAGELTTGERENLEQHVATCESCTLALADARRLEKLMNGLFSDARPDANLDERVIQSVRKEPMRAFKRPTLWRFAAAAAAVLVVGLVGAVAQGLSFEEDLVTHRTVLSDILKQSAGIKPATDMVGGTILADNTASMDINGLVADLEKKFGDKSYSLPATMESALRADYYRESAPGDPAMEPATGEVIMRSRAKGVRGGPMGGGGASEGLDKLTVATKARAPGASSFYDNRDSFMFSVDGKHSEAGETKMPALHLFKPGDSREGGKETKQLETLLKAQTEDSKKATLQDKMAMDDVLQNKLFRMPPMGPTSIPGFYSVPVGGPTATSNPTTSAGGVAGVPPALIPPSSLPAADPGYFGAAKDRLGGIRDKDISKKENPAPPKGINPSLKDSERDDKSDAGEKNKGKGDILPDAETPKKVDPKGVPKVEPEEPPMETNRKIIRTGEMDFETDSFDKAVENITRLITSVKGGFVATINSDKLPNGKMRGSIVVRMPPQFLDKFVLDLRRELAKSGELKNQRIISLDVTKQYTDISSRLRAARAVEDRLIQIIKVGKGEIKDLVAAERELGVWRTKIEEMEGEIRYYSNQVALSTLTLTLSEKEILAPSAIVVTETVRMRLEVDDVTKAHQIAMRAVEEVKGRITRSELKQHAAGQLQSVLQADIPPAQKDAFRDKLNKLGIVSDHEENQSQRTEGGVGRSGELKPRQSDVHFDITMHNTANVRPRLTADLKVATDDVPAAYAKLLDAITKAKGQVRDGKLNEQDKLNITATLDFNVPTSEKPAIDKVLFDIGPVLERTNLQTPISELSTERKFGYTLLLRDFASIPPSKSVIETIATMDVPASFAKLQDAITKAKGQFVDARLDEKDKLNINAQLEFSVPSEEKSAIDKLLLELGSSLSRTNMQAPMKQLSTVRKFGYSLILRDFASVPPSKATDLKVAVADVPTSYAKLVEAITKAKGQVADAKLNEQDKMHVTAQLAFTVPSEEKATIDALLLELGTVLSRNNIQAPINQLSTAKKFGYTVDLRDFATIPPRQASAVTIAASNVPTNFAKILDAIAKAKGQVADAKLDEQDKLNVTGTISFTVPSAEKPTIEKLLAEIGTILSRKNEQAPAAALSTEGKYGFVVILRDFANIPPRETFILQVALHDVPTAFRELQGAATQAKGWVNVGKLVEDNKAKIEAQLDFDVPVAEKAAIEALLAKTGAIISRTSSQVPVNELATDKKVGYRLSLRSTASIPPREKTLLKLEVTNVDEELMKLKEIVLAGKGRVVDSSVDRHESGLVTAAIVFEVPFASQETLIRQMKGAGKLLSQRSTRDPNVTENELTTAHIIVTLAGVNPIVANDKGIGSYVRTSLNLSFNILATIVMTIIVGLSAILPIVLILWFGYKLYTIMAGTNQGPHVMPVTGNSLIPEDDKPAGSDPAARS